MGNETSSVKLHSLLSADDIKNIRTSFPGGGTGAPPTLLNWGIWTNWPSYIVHRLEAILQSQSQGHSQTPAAPGDKAPQSITFHSYQELAGSVVRGTAEERTKLIFAVYERNIKTEGLLASDLLAFVIGIGRVFTSFYTNKRLAKESFTSFGESMVHDLCFPRNQPKKSFLRLSPEDDPELSFEDVERWLVMWSPLFDKMYQLVMARSFGISSQLSLIPPDFYTNHRGTHLLPLDIAFLDASIPSEHKHKWRPLFNSKTDGESFAKMSAAIINKGPTVIIIWEENGAILGGFASKSWTLGPRFFGDNTCFLFNLNPRMYIYESTPFNDHYLYMNTKQKTMPNGLGMGGQLEYFGLWIDQEYGKARCAPSCTTYASPQLSNEEFFHFGHLEVWAVGDEPEKDDENTRSVLDRDPEAQAMLEMMGKTFVSKDVRAADEQDEKAKQDPN